MRVRQRADQVAPADAELLRAGYRALQEISRQNADDERGYQALAGIHGYPLPIWCQHGTSLFLPWHRAYLYTFEMALHDVAPGAAIPWWDWAQRPYHDAGLPKLFEPDPQAPGDNPFADAPVLLRSDYIDWLHQNLPGTISSTDPPRTVRDLDPPDELPKQSTLDALMSAPTFEDFSNRLEFGAHGAIHIWIGGSMSEIPVAAFDPIFWSHHAMIDRLWYLWQIGDAGMDPPHALLDTVLAPFNVTVRQMLDINMLGYEYAVSVT